MERPIDTGDNEPRADDNRNSCNDPNGDGIKSANNLQQPSYSEASTSFDEEIANSKEEKQHSITDAIPIETVATCSNTPTVTVSIDLLPVELLQHIAQTLPASSISALKCINTVFRQVFSRDIFWKNYLHYPVRYLESDMRSGSPAPRVAEVVGEVSAGAVAKWQGYCKLQRARMQTLMTRHFDGYILISIDNESIDNEGLNCVSDLRDMQDMVDEQFERWLFVLTNNSIQSGCCYLRMWNITSTTRALPPFNFGKKGWVVEIMKIQPDGRIILKEGLHGTNTYFIGVYQFENSTLNIRFRIVFCMDICFGPKVEILETETYCDFYYAIVGDLCVTCKAGCISNSKEGTLHVWNLKSGLKIANISLNENNSFQQFIDYGPPSLYDTNNLELAVYKGNSWSVIVLMKISPNLCQVNILDLKMLQLTVLLDACNNIIDAYTFQDKVCFMCNRPNWTSDTSTEFPCFLVYSTKGGPKLLKTIHTDVKDPPCNVVFKHSKALVMRGGILDILHLDTEPVRSQQLTIQTGIILGYIEPRFMFMHCRGLGGVTKVKIINTDDGTELCTWESKEPGKALKRYYHTIQYPSKIIVKVGTKHLKMFLK